MPVQTHNFCRHCSKPLPKTAKQWCARSCQTAFNRRPDRIAKRFWKKVVKPEYGCWLWQGARSVSRYGTFNFKGTNINAHRAAWIITHDFQEPGPGIDVLHTCHKGHLGCVTPHHLYLGTDKDNTRDRVLAGNTTRGERNWSARLKENEVRAIRAAYWCEGRKSNIDELHRQFPHASNGAIYCAARGRSWKHL